MAERVFPSVSTSAVLTHDLVKAQHQKTKLATAIALTLGSLEGRILPNKLRDLWATADVPPRAQRPVMSLLEATYLLSPSCDGHHFVFDTKPDLARFKDWHAQTLLKTPDVEYIRECLCVHSKDTARLIGEVRRLLRENKELREQIKSHKQWQEWIRNIVSNLKIDIRNEGEIFQEKAQSLIEKAFAAIRRDVGAMLPAEGSAEQGRAVPLRTIAMAQEENYIPK